MLSPLALTADVELKSTKDGYGDALVELGDIDKNVFLASSDVVMSTGSGAFSQKYPDRYFEMGVSEQNMAAFGAGLASTGKTVFISAYSAFSPYRNFDQIRTQIAYSNLNVKIVGTHSGFSDGGDGATHQALEDIALMKSLPNINVFTPSDYWEAKKSTLLAASIKGPCYIRLYRVATPVFTTKDTHFRHDDFCEYASGDDAVIFSYGPVSYECLKASKYLKEKGFGLSVVGIHSTAHLTFQELEKHVHNKKHVFIAEEHQINGGIGSDIARILSEYGNYKVKVIAVDKQFGESASYYELLTKHGLDEGGIIKKVLSFVGVASIMGNKSSTK